jgi:hypothetical protein
MEAFTQSAFRQDINQIIDGNYSWLEGHSATPSFSIEVNSIKVSFANQVANYVKQHLSNLPACTEAQALEMANVGPLSLTCVPNSVNPSQAATQIANEIDDSNLLISTPVITANNLKAINHSGGAYYTKLSKAPKVYKWANRVPLFLILIDVILAAAIIFLLGKRKGLRRVGVVLIVSGLLLVIVRLCSNKILSKIDSHINTSSSLGSLKSAFLNIASLIEKSLVKTDLKFGLIYIVLGAILISILLILKKGIGGLGGIKAPKRTKNKSQNEPEQEGEYEEEDRPIRLSNRPPRASMDIMSNSTNYDYGDRKQRPKIETAPPLKNSGSSPTGPRRKPPRLIQ